MRAAHGDFGSACRGHGAANIKAEPHPYGVGLQERAIDEPSISPHGKGYFFSALGGGSNSPAGWPGALLGGAVMIGAPQPGER